jgi:Kef-type K+ transport system membrane component KefB/nucleotide-binding universal stress UspA family protein
MRTTLLYLALVVLPIFGVLAILGVGEGITPPPAIGGEWTVDTAGVAGSSVLLLILQIAVILIAARLVGMAFRWIGQPQVVGEMVAGILLGPSLLGWVAPGAFALLFPPESLPALNSLSQIGLVLFMFLVGVEFDPALLRGRGNAAVITSHVSIVAPFLLGALLALGLYPRLSDASVSFTGFALFMGAAMSVTAFPVLARILTERNLLRTRLGVVAIACAAVDDVSAWTLLALVVVIVRASAAQMPLWLTVGGSVVYVAFMVGVVRRLLFKLESYYLSRGRLTQDMVAGIVLLLLASAWVTEWLGIHALFGAFVLGAVMPKHPRFMHELTDRLQDVTVVLLLPLFFAFTGLRTSIGLVSGTELWLITGLVVLVAVAGKLGGSALAARLTGLSWREAGALGVLMNTRGLMELVILTIGLELGVISPTLFAIMVLMAIVTTFMTTPLLELIYPTRRIREEQLGVTERQGAARASGTTAVVPLSLPSAGPGLLRAAAACAGPAGLRRVYALHLTRAADDLLTDTRPRDAGAGQPVLQPLLDAAAERSTPVTPLHFVSRDVAQDIVDIATVKSADLVVLGWHKPVVSQSILSGTVHDVMRGARGDVAVYVERRIGEWRRLLVPFVSGAQDRRAVELALRIAAVEQAELTVLHAMPPADTPSTGESAEEAAAWLYAQLPASVRVERVTTAHPLRALLEEAQTGYDLIVVGVSSAWGTQPTPFGRRHEAVAERTDASLLIVRAGAHALADPLPDPVPAGDGAAGAAAPSPMAT